VSKKFVLCSYVQRLSTALSFLLSPLFIPSFPVTCFFSPSSSLFPLSCYSPFFENVYLVAALSFLQLILFGPDEGNIIERGMAQNMERMCTKGKWAKRENRREGKVGVKMRRVGRKGSRRTR
jgi:hypothetical protein